MLERFQKEASTFEKEPKNSRTNTFACFINRVMDFTTNWYCNTIGKQDANNTHDWVLRLEETFLTKSSTSLRKNDWKGFQSMRANNAIKELRSYSPMWPNARIFSSEKHWCVILRTSPVRDFYAFHPRTSGARGCSSSTPMAHHLATQGQGTGWQRKRLESSLHVPANLLCHGHNHGIYGRIIHLVYPLVN